MKDKRLMPWWFVVVMILQLSLLSSVVQGYYIIGITDEMVYAGPALVASELGFWQKEGIDIRVEIIADREDMFRNMRMRFNLSGRHCVDFVGCRIGDGAYQRSMGLGIEPIAYVADSPGRIKLVTQEGVDSVARLKGKKVACDFDTANLLFLADTLQEAGLKIDDVDLFDLHGMNSPYLFLQGNVDAIVIDAAGAAQCVAAGGKIISVSQRSGGGTREALFAKGWLIEKEPELAAKFVDGFQQAQLWMNDPENTARLAEIINKKFYWRRYQADAEPLGETFVRSQLVGFEFRKSMKLDREFDEHMATADALFTERARAIRSGEILLPDAYEPTAKTGTALDDAWGWWRFTGSGDFYNYGTGGAALNVKTRGSDKRWDLYGISTADWFSPKRVWTFGGFLNDGYGWATDGVAKYLATTKLQTKAPAGQMGFALWLRCSNRNTTDTVLFSAGPGGKQAGFKILYRSKPAAAFEIVIGGVGGQRVFRLENVPASTFLDVCFSYDAKAGTITGWAYEPKSGNLIVEDSAKIESVPLELAGGVISIGGDADSESRVPLNGNIENVALWTRPLSAKEVRELSTGPAQKAGGTGELAANWNNVKDYGAVGDGEHDDTDAIQQAIDACIYPLTIKDIYPDVPPKEGYGFGGVVFIPQGVYRTTRPLVLKKDITVIGDEAKRPTILSEAEAGVVFWGAGVPWYDRPIDFKVRKGLHMLCDGVTLKNLHISGKRFGAHTMGNSTNALRMSNCRVEGAEAGFVTTGFMMFSRIADCQFDPSLWILAKEGTRFNTGTIEYITVGLHGLRSEKWALRLEGCIQCVHLSEIIFEVRGRGILLDSYAAGVSIDISNIWNYDTGGPAEVLRIINGSGISVRNIMGLDHPSTVFIGKNVRNIKMENIMGKSITVEDAKATRPIFSNVPTIKHGDHESMIEDDMGGSKDLK